MPSDAVARLEMIPFAGQNMELVSTSNTHVLGDLRIREGHRMIVLANFSQESRSVEGNRLPTDGLGRFFPGRYSKQDRYDFRSRSTRTLSNSVAETRVNG